MPELVCPVSTETIDKRSARVGATLTAILLMVYALTGSWPLLLLIVADYCVRVLTSYRSPIAVVSGLLVRSVGMAPKPKNKGPKIFAWRIGFLLAVVSLALVQVSPTASIVVATVLAGFNVLDGVGNYCVGCVVYTYFVLPRFGPAETRAN